MRAVKSVITAAGNLKRAYPDESEDVLLLRGLRDINVPKFLTQDLPLFAGIISDLYPRVAPSAIVYDDLLDALSRCCLKVYVQPVNIFVDKVISHYTIQFLKYQLFLSFFFFQSFYSCRILIVRIFYLLLCFIF